MKIVSGLENVFFGTNEQVQGEKLDDVDLQDESLFVRGTRSLQDIYNNCSLAIANPTTLAEAQSDANWRATIKAKMAMIQKNET